MIKLLHVSLIDEDTVKIFLKDTENIKLLGHVLTNETSRSIMSLLAEEEMYPNEIANKLNLGLKLVLHHLDKLEKINLVIVTNKKLIKKGIKHKHYKMIPNIFIAISKTQKEIHETGFLRRIFKDSVKFAAIGIASGVAWLIQDYSSQNADGYMIAKDSDFTLSLIIIIIGLSIILIKKRIGKTSNHK